MATILELQILSIFNFFFVVENNWPFWGSLWGFIKIPSKSASLPWYFVILITSGKHSLKIQSKRKMTYCWKKRKKEFIDINLAVILSIKLSFLHSFILSRWLIHFMLFETWTGRHRNMRNANRHRFPPHVTGPGIWAWDWVASTGLFVSKCNICPVLVDANNQVVSRHILNDVFSFIKQNVLLFD